MKKISVIIVDDQDVDRYIVKRRLSRSEGFGEVMEAPTGDDFLKDFFNGDGSKKVASLPLLVLMDINMPGRNGFETVEELQKRMAEGRGPESVVIMMFTTSDNPADRERALQLDSVKGYIVKPLDDDGIQRIRDLYYS